MLVIFAVIALGLSYFSLSRKISNLSDTILRMERESARFEEGFKNKTTNFCTKNDIEKLSIEFFTKNDAVVLFDKAVGAVRERTENLEDEFVEFQCEMSLRLEHFLTKETVKDIFDEYQESAVEEYKLFKDKRWDRLSEAFTRK